MNQNETKELVKQFIESRFQMVIATNGEYPWIATVYYSFDEDLNLYFLSNPVTIHCNQIAKNPKVAVSISDSPQAASAKKKGIQIYGKAEQILEKDEIISALNLWRKTLNVQSESYSYEGMMKNLIDGRMYKITPKKIKFFNQEIWEEGQEPLIEL